MCGPPSVILLRARRASRGGRRFRVAGGRSGGDGGRRYQRVDVLRRGRARGVLKGERARPRRYSDVRLSESGNRRSECA